MSLNEIWHLCHWYLELDLTFIQIHSSQRHYALRHTYYDHEHMQLLVLSFVFTLSSPVIHLTLQIS